MSSELADRIERRRQSMRIAEQRLQEERIVELEAERDEAVAMLAECTPDVLVSYLRGASERYTKAHTLLARLEGEK